MRIHRGHRLAGFARPALALPVLLVLVLPTQARAQTSPPPPNGTEGATPASPQPPGQGPTAATSQKQAPAQELQTEIYVLVDQARGILEEARLREPLSDEARLLATRVEELLADCEKVHEISSVPQLQALLHRLLDTPVRLHQLLAAEVTEEASPDAAEADDDRAEANRAEANRAEANGDAASPPGADSVPGAPEAGGPGSDSGRPLGGEMPPPIPEALREGARAFFGGEYQHALEVLDPVSLQRPRAQAQVHLLRAAARYSLFLMSEATDDGETILDGVRSDLQEAIRLDPGLRPDSRLFSPRFVRFFRDLARG